MSVLPINEIHPGMILAADVHDSHGRFLLGRDMVLTENHMRIFRIWGVTDVQIASDALQHSRSERCKAMPPAIHEQAEDIVGLYMGPAVQGEHQAWAELRRIFRQRTAERIQAGHLKEIEIRRQIVADDGAARPMPLQPIDPQLLLNKELELASLPDIFFQIQDAINNPRSSAIHISEVISRDQSLSAKLLRIANSAFYGFPSRIDTISRAVTIIGTRQLSMLALGTAVITKFQEIPGYLMDMETFWKQSIACGIGARFLASARNLSNTESFFVSGMMHSLGQLVMLKYHPAQFARAMSLAGKENVCLTKIENRLFGFDHAWLGAEMIRGWRLPARLEQAVAHQYAPSRSCYPLESTIVHIAVILARGMTMGARPAGPLPALDREAWDQENFPLGILSATFNHMTSQVDAIYRLLFNAEQEQQ